MDTPVAALQSIPFFRAIKEIAWLYPMLECVHIAGFALLFGSIAVLDARLLGFGRTLGAKALAGHVLPWTLAGFALALPAGLLMFGSNAADFITNRAFVAKMALLMAAGLNAAVFHASVRLADDREPSGQARLHAAVSLAIWVGVIFCGRWIAYV